MNDARNKVLQSLCREYLARLYTLASKYGLGGFIKETIQLNRQEKCQGTEEEVELLARCVNDDRIARNDIPKLFGKSYRQCESKGDFDKIKKLGHVGTYSKVSALLFKHEQKDEDAKTLC